MRVPLPRAIALVGLILTCGLLLPPRLRFASSHSPPPSPPPGGSDWVPLDDAPWRTWRILMKVDVANPAAKELAVRVRCPLPVSHPGQQVALESVTPPESGRSADSWANPLLEFRPGPLAPGARTTVSLALQVRSRQQVVDVDASAVPRTSELPPEVQGELASSEQFPSQDPVLRAEVQGLLEKEPNPWYRALRLYDFTRSLHFQLTRHPRDVREVLRTRLAQCSDAAALFVTLCRAAGIPARYVAGIYLTEGSTSLDEMHAWAEFWLPGAGWVPADPTQARFDDSLRLSRFASTVPEYIRLWEGTPRAAGVAVDPPASSGTTPRLSLHFEVQPVPPESGGRPLVERFPVPPLPATLPSPVPTTAPAESEEALRQMARGHRSEAATLAERAVTAHPASWEAWRAWFETTTGEMDLSALAQRMQGPVRKAPAWIGRSVEGLLLVRAQQWSNAERSLVEAVSLHDSTETHENLGRFFLQTRQVSKALGEYSKALGCDPRNLHVHRDLVSLFVALEAWDGVAQACAQAQVAFPAVVDFPLSAGQALHRLGQHEKAREAFQAALQLTPGDGWLHAMLGWTLKDLHDPTGALREIEQGLKLGIAAPEKAFFEGMARDLRTQR